MLLRPWYIISLLVTSTIGQPYFEACQDKECNIPNIHHGFLSKQFTGEKVETEKSQYLFLYAIH